MSRHLVLGVDERHTRRIRSDTHHIVNVLVSGFLAALRAGHLVAAGGVRDGLIFTEARQRGTLLVNGMQAIYHACCVWTHSLALLNK